MENSEQSPLQPTPEHNERSHFERFFNDLDKIDALILDILLNEANDLSDLQQTWIARAQLTEQFIAWLDSTLKMRDRLPRTQFDIMIAKALIFEKTGKMVRYLEELDAAEVFALTYQLDDVIASLGEELDEKIGELGSTPEEFILKLRGYIDFPNREYLRELLAEGIDDQDLIGAINGMIADAGGDPDEILKLLGITE